MQIILHDNPTTWLQLLPLTYTRPISTLRCGLFTAQERWEKLLLAEVYYNTEDYLQSKFPNLDSDNKAEVLHINASVLGFNALANEIQEAVASNQSFHLKKNELSIAWLGETKDQKEIQTELPDTELASIEQSWDIFSLNEWALQKDFEWFTANRTSASIDSSNAVRGTRLFVEEGAQVYNSILNTESGPIYIGKDALIMEGSILRGSIGIGEQSVLKMGAKIYGGTTLGPGCKVGGEVQNVIFFANSNKAHDGYLGNSVIGEWCNLGADSNNSNLKNNYEQVKLWSEAKESFVRTGKQFCGLIMADHAKCGINTMFNTGTVVGVSCNIFGAGFPRNFIPSFSWGGSGGFTEYQLAKASDTANRVFERRNLSFDETERAIFQEIFNRTAGQRRS
jgi:UDP-N-acetylglucosamine diphosphorylase/glucosamine-1-phosphate N-acetyltransferase